MSRRDFGEHIQVDPTMTPGQEKAMAAMDAMIDTVKRCRKAPSGAKYTIVVDLGRDLPGRDRYSLTTTADLEQMREAILSIAESLGKPSASDMAAANSAVRDFLSEGVQ